MSGSVWRAGDVVAFDEARDAADLLLAYMIRDAQAGVATPDWLDEVRSLRERTHALDGFDRAAIDALRDEIDGRLGELRTDR